MLEGTYELITARSGQEALALFYQGLIPHLILLDLTMPEMNGWDTYDRMKAISNLHHVPTAIFTSSEDPNEKDRAYKMGADDFITKPVKKSDLLARIEKLIRKD